MAPSTKTPPSQTVVLATILVAASVPIVGAVANWIQARASAATLQKVEVAVNHKSDEAIDQIKSLIQANKDLTSKMAVLEERLRPTPEATKTVTLTEEQLNRLLNRK